MLDRYDILAQNAVCKSIRANKKAFQKLRQMMVPFSFKTWLIFFGKLSFDFLGFSSDAAASATGSLGGS